MSAGCSHARGGRSPGGQNDVHVVGISTLAAGHLTLVPALKAALERKAAATSWSWLAA
jgi:hypothetical protein